MAAVKTKVEKIIASEPVVVFSKSYCPYCNATKKLLNDFKIEYAVHELDNLSDGSAMQDALQEISGQRSVPNVYIKQEHIGGNSDLQALAQKDGLKPLLVAAGVL